MSMPDRPTPPPRARAALLLAVAALGAGCSRDGVASAADAAEAVADLASPGRWPDLASTPGPWDASGQDDCIGDSNTIYLGGAVPNEGAALYSFDPSTFTFKKIGPLVGCPPSVWSKGGFYPTAMALDRTTAWMNFWDGGKQILRERLYKIDLATGACTDTGADLTSPYASFLLSGLAPVPDKRDPSKDVLHATIQFQEGAGGMVTWLATVDTAALRVTPVAPTSAATKLAYTGDGRLFGFMGGALVELDPVTAKVKSSKPVKLPIQSWPGMALAFFQKQLWIFVSANGPLDSTVHAYLVDLATGTVVEKATQKDFYATGAVVQPCVAIPPPG